MTPANPSIDVAQSHLPRHFSTCLRDLLQLLHILVRVEKRRPFSRCRAEHVGGWQAHQLEKGRVSVYAAIVEIVTGNIVRRMLHDGAKGLFACVEPSLRLLAFGDIACE